jgi:transketolase
MAAILNGLAYHGSGLVPYGGTFAVFAGYMVGAMRLSALSELGVIYVLTHDSIGLGEDGPTHQSVEHVPSLRIIPNLDVWRPADGLETAVSWAASLERHDGPSALCLSRQNLPRLSAIEQMDGIRRGGYVLADAADARAVLIGTGSELSIAMEARERLAAEGIAVRVVSMPSTNVFDRQERGYRDSVLPAALPAVAVEAAQPDFWHKYTGRSGTIVGVASFGESAPAKDLYTHFGITAAAVAQAVKDLLA